MSTICRAPAPKLSICITTLNRAAFIAATLDSIVMQLTNECELVVLDAGSTDGTERVVAEYAVRCATLRYIKQDTNNGIDRDYDRTVELAQGDYCWLMTDDDLLKPGAVAGVLQGLSRDCSLLIVNGESRDFTMSSIVLHRWLAFDADRVYGPHEMDRLFIEVGTVLRYIGCTVIRRDIWLARERRSYYGSWYLYLGVIFQRSLPGEVLVLASPLISYRMSNVHTFSPHMKEIVFSKWPRLVDSLALAVSTKSQVNGAQPWRHFYDLLSLRAMDNYSVDEYRRWILPRLQSARARLMPRLVASMPGVIANTVLVAYCSLSRQPTRAHHLQTLRESRFYWRNWLGFDDRGRGEAATVRKPRTDGAAAD